MAWLEPPVRITTPPASENKPPPSSRRRPPRVPGAARTLPPMPLPESVEAAADGVVGEGVVPARHHTMEVEMSWLELVDAQRKHRDDDAAASETANASERGALSSERTESDPAEAPGAVETAGAVPSGAGSNGAEGNASKDALGLDAISPESAQPATERAVRPVSTRPSRAPSMRPSRGPSSRPLPIEQVLTARPKSRKPLRRED